MLSYWRIGTQLAILMEESPARAIPEVLRLIGQSNDFHLPVEIYGVGHSTGSMYGVAAVLALLTGGSLLAACFIIATTALVGKTLLFRALASRLPEQRRVAALLVIVCLPSLVFWSAGLLKESLVIGPIGFAIYGLTCLDRGKRVRGLLILASVSMVLATFKAYLLFPLTIAAGAYWYARHSIDRTGRVRIRVAPLILSGVATISLLVVLGELFPRYSIDNFEEEANRLQIVGANVAGGSNYSLTEPSEARRLGAILFAPLALLTALFRPFLFEANSPLTLAAAIETTVGLLLSIRLLLIGRWSRLRDRILASPILILCLVFTVVAGIAIGLSTTNFGTLSRYRIPIMPFFGFLLVALQPLEASSLASTRSAIPEVLSRRPRARVP